MNSGELIALVERELKGLSTQFDPQDYNDAVEQAMRDCGWSFPQSSDFKITWLKSRTKRHLFFALASESAHKFKYKQINLQHRFQHYFDLVKEMDHDFNAAMDENVAEFAGVEAYEMFGHKADAGFQYDEYGRDTTYDDDNIVVFDPEKA